MENQINIGDQNTQQIGQKSVNQPIQVPLKQKINYWVIASVVFVILLIVTILSWFLVHDKLNEESSAQKQNIINTSNPITPTPGYPNKENLTIDMPKVWTLERDWLKVYIPQGAVPVDSLVAFMLVPEPIDENLSNINLNGSFQISGSSDNKRNQLINLQSNLVIYQPLNINDPRLVLLHKETLNYYFWDKDKSEWIPIPSLINFERGYALAKHNKFGTYSLRGNPVNKAPKILSVEPNKIKYNQDVAITIKGENFQSDSFVNFGMGAYALEFVDSSTIRVRMKEDNNFLISPGTYVLTIRNPDGQGTHLIEALKVEE